MKSTFAQPNLRDQQRVDVTADILLERPDGCQCNCTTANLSRSGVMVSCDQSTANLLIQGDRALASGSPIYVKARFSVPMQPAQPVIIAAGKIVHFRRMAQDWFQVGIQFEKFEGGGSACVDQYVRSLLNERGKSA
ncbi:MAG: PilZ domain-containing protein [Marinobacter sp.]